MEEIERTRRKRKRRKITPKLPIQHMEKFNIDCFNNDLKNRDIGPGYFTY